MDCGLNSGYYFLFRNLRARALTFGYDAFAPADICWFAFWRMKRAGTFLSGLD